MDHLSRKVPDDTSLISLSEEWEVKWWSNKLGVSAPQLAVAVAEVGNSPEKVKKYLNSEN